MQEEPMIKTINVSRLVKSFGLILSLIPFADASAQNFARFVDSGRTTLDTETGLEWLDLTETMGISYFDLLGELNPGGLFEGYRYASTGELYGLFEGLGVLEASDPFYFSSYYNSPEDWGMTYNGVANGGDLKFVALFGQTRVIPDDYDYDAGPIPGSDTLPLWSGGLGEPYYSSTVYLLARHYGITINKRWGGYDSDGGEWTIHFSELNLNGSRAIDGEQNRAALWSWGWFLVRDTSSPRPVPEINGGTAPLALGLLLMTYLVRRESRRRQCCC
jgi:hypothetical protein